MFVSLNTSVRSVGDSGSAEIQPFQALHFSNMDQRRVRNLRVAKRQSFQRKCGETLQATAVDSKPGEIEKPHAFESFGVRQSSVGEPRVAAQT